MFLVYSHFAYFSEPAVPSSLCSYYVPSVPAVPRVSAVPYVPSVFPVCLLFFSEPAIPSVPAVHSSICS